LMSAQKDMDTIRLLTNLPPPYRNRRRRMSERLISEVYTYIALLAHSRGARNIKDSPGLYEIKIDEHWVAQMNPHEETTDNVPPYHMAIFYNGWPAGLIHGVSGGVICAGEAANEDTLLAAVRATADAEGINLVALSELEEEA